MKRKIMIMGGGLIGASIAAHLSENSKNEVHLFESESIVGFHSSGRNAGMLRSVTTNEDLTTFLYESALSLKSFLGKKGEQLYGNIGSILCVDDAEFENYMPSVDLVEESKEISRSEACTLAPLIEAMPLKRFVYSTVDAVIDVRGLLQRYLEEVLRFGGKIHRAVRVQSLDFGKNDRVVIRTTRGVFHGDIVVNASGSYAGLVETRGDLKTIEFEPRRRTVLITNSTFRRSSTYPFVWDVSAGFYFRPEEPGFLVCPCDEQILGPEETLPEKTADELFHEKAKDICPPLAHEKIAFRWTGLRTFSPDNRFVLGPDPKEPRYVWAAGLGGHGVTASKKVGERIRDQIEGKTIRDGFSPDRFYGGSVE